MYRAIQKDSDLQQIKSRHVTDRLRAEYVERQRRSAEVPSVSPAGAMSLSAQNRWDGLTQARTGSCAGRTKALRI